MRLITLTFLVLSFGALAVEAATTTQQGLDKAAPYLTQAIALVTLDQEPRGTAVRIDQEGWVMVTAAHVVGECLRTPSETCEGLGLRFASGAGSFAPAVTGWTVRISADHNVAILERSRVSPLLPLITPPTLKVPVDTRFCASYTGLQNKSAAERTGATDDLSRSLSTLWRDRALVSRIGVSSAHTNYLVIRSLVRRFGLEDLVGNEAILPLAATEVAGAAHDSGWQASRAVVSLTPGADYHGLWLALSATSMHTPTQSGFLNDCEGNSGSSGGALFDHRLRLIGITQGISGAAASIFRSIARIGSLLHTPWSTDNINTRLQ